MGGKSKEGKEKPLEKMTAKELREMAKEIPDITGAHGMNKPELISAIKAAKGIKESEKKKKSSMRDVKAKIKVLKAERASALESKDGLTASILRRKISRLKKQTRRSA